MRQVQERLSLTFVSQSGATSIYFQGCFDIHVSCERELFDAVEKHEVVKDHLDCKN